MQHFVLGRHAMFMTTISPNTLMLEELDWLRTLATRLAAGGDEDDLVQETVIAAWKANPQTAPDRPLRPWLAAVARNRARMNARARSRREQREHEGAAAVTPSAGLRPDDELARISALQAVAAALDELPELDRRITIRSRRTATARERSSRSSRASPSDPRHPGLRQRCPAAVVTRSLRPSLGADA